MQSTLTRLSDMGVLSLAGRCCSSASTIQLAMMVARIMYSNGVRRLRSTNGFHGHDNTHLKKTCN